MYALQYKDTGTYFVAYWTERIVEGFGGEDTKEQFYDIYIVDPNYSKFNIYQNKTEAFNCKKTILREARGSGLCLVESDIRVVRIEE